MDNLLIILQIILSIILIVFILVQNKGTGFGRVWGGSPSFTRRGLEKIIFKLTFVFTGLFVILSLIILTI